jgi:thiamine-phosphate pyrophosphorylase
MKRNAAINYSLYLVTDQSLLKGKNLLKSIEDAIIGGVTIVQLREKELGTKDFFDLAKQVKVVTDKYQVPLIINDRLDIALAVDAAGLHIGQDDLPIIVARKILGPAKILGISASNVEEAITAQVDGADYIGVGAIFPTGTKLDALQVNLETLRLIKNKVTIPVVAIGGINQNNALLVINEKIDGIAVVSAILAEHDCRQAAQKLHDLIHTSIEPAALNATNETLV